MFNVIMGISLLSMSCMIGLLKFVLIANALGIVLVAVAKP